MAGVYFLAGTAEKTRGEAEQLLAGTQRRRLHWARQETRGGGTALTPPPGTGRQLGAAPTQPYVPGGRSPLRVLYTVSPALESSAVPATMSRASLDAILLRRMVPSWTVRDGWTRRRRRLALHYIRDVMGMVMLMDVTGSTARVKGSFVTGTEGVAGTGTVGGVSDAAFSVLAQKAIMVTALGAAVESGPWVRRRRRALAVAAPFLAPFHP